MKRNERREVNDDVAGNATVGAALLVLANLSPNPLGSQLAPSVLTLLAWGASSHSLPSFRKMEAIVD